MYLIENQMKWVSFDDIKRSTESSDTLIKLFLIALYERQLLKVKDGMNNIFEYPETWENPENIVDYQVQLIYRPHRKKRRRKRKISFADLKIGILQPVPA